VSDSRVDRVHFPVGAVASVENLNDSFLGRWTLPNNAALPFLCHPTLQFARLAIVIINQGAAGFAVWVKKCIHEAGRAPRRFFPKPKSRSLVEGESTSAVFELIPNFPN